jgi:hypothetical protein
MVKNNKDDNQTQAPRHVPSVVVAEPGGGGNGGDTVGCDLSKNGNFPMRLHYVLTDMENDGLEHIMCWQPHGRCFIVRHRKLLEQMILPL